MPVDAARQAELAGSQVPWRFAVSKIIDAADYGPDGHEPSSAARASWAESDIAASSSRSPSRAPVCIPAAVLHPISGSSSQAMTNYLNNIQFASYKALIVMSDLVFQLLHCEIVSNAMYGIDELD